MKTIFSKYLVSFILLLGIGFLAIAIVLSSVVSGYSSDNKKSIMSNTAYTLYVEIYSMMQRSEKSFSDVCTDEAQFISLMAEPLSEYAESVVIITNAKGNILVKEGKGKELIEKKYADVNEIISSTDTKHDFVYSNLNGLFSKRRFNFIYTISGNKEDSIDGLIILSSTGVGLNTIRGEIITVIIMSCIWTFLAAIIAVYFITSRVTSPLKSMSKAAKSYSKGDFSPRVKVRGNDEISDLANAFNQMAQSLEQFENTRSTFLSNVSHDLRTPMTSIQGFIDGILDGTIPPDSQDYYLKIVSDEVKRLSRLVNSLLEISRLESGKVKINKTNFDICEIARLILISFEEKINEKNLEIEFVTDEDPANVYADRDAVHQVLYNLIHNAIKFTENAGTLKISIRNMGRKFEVSIFNTGTGIKKEDLPYVFDRFYKTDSSRGLDKTGTGLGLYIVKTKIEAHGEKVSVESEYGKNCCFKFTLAKTLPLSL